MQAFRPREQEAGLHDACASFARHALPTNRQQLQAPRRLSLAQHAALTFQPCPGTLHNPWARGLQVVTSKVLSAEKVLHLDGGVYRWAAAGLPMVGEYDGSNAGRTPNVAEKPAGEWAGGGGPCWR